MPALARNAGKVLEPREVPTQLTPTTRLALETLEVLPDGGTVRLA